VKYLWGFAGTFVIVGFLNGLVFARFDQDHATGHLANVAMFKENLFESVKLYGVGLLLVRLLAN
jgi:hypothetical protein